MNAGVMKWIVPWEFSWVFLIVFVAVAAAYVAGTRRLHVAPLRQAAFWAGMAIVYVALHTYFDYFAEHEFFMHRIQQVLLHHLAPLFLIAAYPGTVLRAGVPFRVRVVLRRAGRTLPWRVLSACLFNPAFVTAFFVALILVWLVPDMQTLA